MVKILFACLVSTLAVCGLVSAHSISVGNGNIIYQVLFSSWANPAAKLFTGDNCGTFGLVIAEKCDTRFIGYVDVLPDNDTRSTSEYTWPGPKKENNWPQIGDDKYAANRLKDFAYLNLTGVESEGFREGILRVKVQDKNIFNNAEINSYIGRLPGLKDLVVTRYEGDSKFGEPIELDALTTVLPNARDVKKYKPDRATVQQQYLFVKVRAWGEDLQAVSTRRTSPWSSRVPPTREDTLLTNNADKDSDDAIVQSDVTTSSGDVQPKKHHHHHHHHHKYSTTTEDSLSGSVGAPSGGGSYVRNPSSDNYNRYRNSDTENTEKDV